MLFPILGPSSLPGVVAQFEEQLLCWSGITDTAHTTSGSKRRRSTIKPFIFAFIIQRIHNSGRLLNNLCCIWLID